MASPTEPAPVQPLRLVRGAAVGGAILGFLGVALGAFGAHALGPHLGPEALRTFETGVRYQLVHAVALMVSSAVLYGRASWMASWGWRLLLVGTVVFSGSLYVLAVTGIGVFGAITPLGGIALLTGWVLFGAAAGTA